MKKTVDQLLKWLPKEIKLEGGTVRFPGSIHENNAVSIRCISTFKMRNGGIINRGETYIGRGKDFKEGLIQAYITINTMAHYRTIKT